MLAMNQNGTKEAGGSSSSSYKNKHNYHWWGCQKMQSIYGEKDRLEYL
jgi:hypothetical protein